MSPEPCTCPSKWWQACVDGRIIEADEKPDGNFIGYDIGPCTCPACHPQEVDS